MSFQPCKQPKAVMISAQLFGGIRTNPQIRVVDILADEPVDDMTLYIVTARPGSRLSYLSFCGRCKRVAVALQCIKECPGFTFLSERRDDPVLLRPMQLCICIARKENRQRGSWEFIKVFYVERIETRSQVNGSNPKFLLGRKMAEPEPSAFGRKEPSRHPENGPVIDNASPPSFRFHLMAQECPFSKLLCRPAYRRSADFLNCNCTQRRGASGVNGRQCSLAKVSRNTSPVPPTYGERRGGAEARSACLGLEEVQDLISIGLNFGAKSANVNPSFVRQGAAEEGRFLSCGWGSVTRRCHKTVPDPCSP